MEMQLFLKTWLKKFKWTQGNQVQIIYGKANGKKANDMRAKMIPSRDDTRSENMNMQKR